MSEVYRYVPGGSAEFKYFAVPGLEVDSSHSRPNQLVMRVNGPLGSGAYRCNRNCL